MLSALAHLLWKGALCKFYYDHYYDYDYDDEKLLNAEVHTTQELNLLVILPDLSCERPRVRRHLNVKIQN